MDTAAPTADPTADPTAGTIRAKPILSPRGCRGRGCLGRGYRGRAVQNRGDAHAASVGATQCTLGWRLVELVVELAVGFAVRLAVGAAVVLAVGAGGRVGSIRSFLSFKFSPIRILNFSRMHFKISLCFNPTPGGEFYFPPVLTAAAVSDADWCLQSDDLPDFRFTLSPGR